MATVNKQAKTESSHFIQAFSKRAGWFWAAWTLVTPIEKDNIPHLHMYILSQQKARAQTGPMTHKAGQVITSAGRIWLLCKQRTPQSCFSLQMQANMSQHEQTDRREESSHCCSKSMDSTKGVSSVAPTASRERASRGRDHNHLLCQPQTGLNENQWLPCFLPINKQDGSPLQG